MPQFSNLDVQKSDAELETFLWNVTSQCMSVLALLLPIIDRAALGLDDWTYTDLSSQRIHDRNRLDAADSLNEINSALFLFASSLNYYGNTLDITRDFYDYILDLARLKLKKVKSEFESPDEIFRDDTESFGLVCLLSIFNAFFDDETVNFPEITLTVHYMKSVDIASNCLTVENPCILKDAMKLITSTNEVTEYFEFEENLEEVYDRLQIVSRLTKLLGHSHWCVRQKAAILLILLSDTETVSGLDDDTMGHIVSYFYSDVIDIAEVVRLAQRCKPVARPQVVPYLPHFVKTWNLTISDSCLDLLRDVLWYGKNEEIAKFPSFLFDEANTVLTVLQNLNKIEYSTTDLRELRGTALELSGKVCKELFAKALAENSDEGHVSKEVASAYANQFREATLNMLGSGTESEPLFEICSKFLSLHATSDNNVSS